MWPALLYSPDQARAQEDGSLTVLFYQSTSIPLLWLLAPKLNEPQTDCVNLRDNYELFFIFVVRFSVCMQGSVGVKTDTEVFSGWVSKLSAKQSSRKGIPKINLLGIKCSWLVAKFFFGLSFAELLMVTLSPGKKIKKIYRNFSTCHP